MKRKFLPAGWVGLCMLLAALIAACSRSGASLPTPEAAVTIFAPGVVLTTPAPAVTIFPTLPPNAVLTKDGVPVTVFPTPSDTPTPTQTHTPTQTPTFTHTPTPTPTPTATISPFAARVNGSITISKEALAAEIKRISNFNVSIATPVPRATASITAAAQLRTEVLEQMIVTALIEDAAIRQGAQLDALAEVEFNRAVTARGGLAQFGLWLRDTGQQEADVRAQARRQAASRAVSSAIYTSVATQTEHIRAAHILLGSEAEATAALAQIAAGTPFDEVARARSLDAATRGLGGALGWIAPGAGQLAWPELEETLRTAPVGVLRAPVRSAVGYHLLQVTAREVRALGPAELARVREASLVAWMNKLRADASVEYFP